MKRTIIQTLKSWAHDSRRKPLLVRGARQVGKTYVISQFATNEFEQCININFELEPEYKSCFQSLKPTDIVRDIELISGATITAGKTLLFLDEIQDCPEAIQALRYFKELMPELHVIGAGSLLEFALDKEQFRMPVGRVQYLYLKPLSFCEFLDAMGEQQLTDFIENYDFGMTINQAVHERLLQWVRVYNILGGMPEVIDEYRENQNFNRCFITQAALLKTYRDDFSKYASMVELNYLQKVFERIPGLTARHFKYVDIDPNMRSRDIKNAMCLLEKAGLTVPCHYTAANGLPLNLFTNEKKFKLLFLDVGLITRLSDLNIQKILNEDLLLANRGALAEQFVGQELLAYHAPFDEERLFYWEGLKPNSIAEIDYVTCVNGQIIPIEVKAGVTGRLKSLKQFIEARELPLGIRISQLPLQLDNNILSIPFYLISKMESFIKAVKTV